MEIEITVQSHGINDSADNDLSVIQVAAIATLDGGDNDKFVLTTLRRDLNKAMKEIKVARRKNSHRISRSRSS